MKNKALSGMGIKPIAVVLIIVLMLTPLAYSVADHLFHFGSDDVGPFLERPDPKFKECVKDTEYMRLHHWELLREIREEVVRYGIRGEVDLAKCMDCHTSREKFCDKCHNEVSLTPDCFGCHYYP